MAATNQGFATGADRQADELRRRAGGPAQDGAIQQPIIDDKKKQQVSRARLDPDAHVD